MIIQCANCRKKYKYDAGRFDGKETKKIRCPACSTVFEVRNPEFAATTDTTTAIRATDVVDAVRQKVVDELFARKKISLAFLTGEMAGQVFQIHKTEISIGRAGTDVVLDDPECSRIHAVLEIGSDGVLLRDLNSTNGTFMDGIRVTESPIKNQEEFTIGGTTMMLIVRDTEGALT